jgi:hypothetical protein
MTEFSAELARHHPDLPVYLLVPPETVARFGATGTFVVGASVNGLDIGRRSVKPWGEGRWFLELTKAHCTALSVEEGDAVQVRRQTVPQTPPDLEAAIRADGLTDAWTAVSEAQRRAVSEEVFAAKRPATRAARIAKAVAWLHERK